MPPKRTIKKYVKVADIPHILKNAGMYVGVVNKITKERWLYNPKSKKFELKKVTYSPALEKIVDEGIVNAYDQYIRINIVEQKKSRSQYKKYPGVSEIKIYYDKETGRITIFNNGPGFDIYYDDEEKMYSVELALTEVRTSETYEIEKRITGGKHGYGVKLAVIFSKTFTIETVDPIRQIKYTQTYENNLSKKIKPKIVKNYVGESYTQISFIPDFRRFEMTKLENDIMQLIGKRAYDLAGTIGKDVNIYLNDKQIPIDSFEDYSSLYVDGKLSCNKFNKYWTVCVGDNEYDKFMQVSFVNGINTYEGGTHVDYIVKQIEKKIKARLVKSNKKFQKLTYTMIRNNMFIFINSTIVNPDFPAQTKASMQSRPDKFGSMCNITDAFIDRICKETNIVRKIKDFLLATEQVALQKVSGSRLGRISIPKLEEANNAGKKSGNKNQKCILILTEGDSAKTFAMSGLSVVGRDFFGVYPLKGKSMNVRSKSDVAVSKNIELTNITKIMGLQHKKKYIDTSELRYGHIMILTDADVDGSHIKGLIINFLNKYWPELTKISGFVQTFITPILKATKGKGKNKQVREFYSKSEFNTWKTRVDLSKWSIKYYKGLGTNTRQEAIGYFKKFDKLQKNFVWRDAKDDQCIQLAFGKDTDKRKEWLKKYNPNYILDNSKTEVSYCEFVNQELIHFSTYDNVRSIPNLMDGFKPSQRKIIHTVFKKNVTKDIKVAQLGAIVAKETEYEHGEINLYGTIINLAQDFVGSNNIELLEPIGAFGSRLKGGDDASQPRYIFTKINEITNYLFNRMDLDILTYLESEGVLIEPLWFTPVIPIILCNGVKGIGTGYSTNIPSYNPMDVVTNIKNKLVDKKLKPMIPWYRGFTGQIIKVCPGKYITKGKYSIIKDNVIRITELPIGVWTDDYKEKFLESILITNKESKHPIIRKYDSQSTDIAVDIILYLDPGIFAKLKGKLNQSDTIDVFEKTLGLANTLATTNMHLFDANNMIKKYNSPIDIINEFYPIRLEYYNKRRKHYLEVYANQFKQLNNKRKFIELVLAGKIIINNRKKDDVIAQIKQYKLYSISEENNNFQGYGYLIKLPLYSLTKEKVDELKGECMKKKKEFDTLKNKSHKQLWIDDLDKFVFEYSKFMIAYKKKYS